MKSLLRNKLTTKLIILMPSNPMLRYLIGNYNYFKILSAKALKNVCDKYPRENIVYSEQKTIISVFDGEVINPGLADCLKGICSLFYWCKLCNYEFKISFH